MVTRRPYKNKEGKASSEAGIAHNLEMNNRRKAGKKGTKWQHS